MPFVERTRELQELTRAPGKCPSDSRYRVLAICEHPVQYHAPLLRKMAAREDLDLHVAYCTMSGAEAAYDREFAATVKWDIPMLDGYRWTHVPNRGSGDDSFWGLFNPGLRRIIREGHFDAVVCYVRYVRSTFWVSLFAAKSSGSAFLFGTDSTSLSSRGGNRWRPILKRMIWPFLFRLADQVIVPSSKGRELMRKLGLLEDRVTLTPYVVDNDWWTEESSKVDRDATRASWGVSQSDTVILFCAKLQPWKRPFDVLRAFGDAGLPNAFLVFAGEGPLRTELEAEVAALDLCARVRFLGFVNQSQLPAVYKSSEIMVLPSEYEPFAVVVNEAMCCGCPVVTSDRVGASHDLVIPGSTGYVYPCFDIPSLVGILKKVAANPEKMKCMRQAASERMKSWSPEENISSTTEAIRVAISRVRRSSRAKRHPQPRNMENPQ